MTDTAASAVTTTAAPAVEQSLDADIASFLQSEPDAKSGETNESLEDAGADASDSPALAQVEDGDDEDDGEESTKTDSTTAKLSDDLDVAKLIAAVDAEDLPGLIEALGPAADKLLTSSAHKALRLATKDLNKKKKEAEAMIQKADNLSVRLNEKYSDPIEIRKSITAQDPKAVDMFIDYAEKTTGADWNAIMKWVGANIAGRPTRLAAREQAKTAEVEQQTTAQKQALEQTQTWVKAEVTKADAALLTEMPEVVDLVIDEIRKGYSRGIDNPAKALPLVLKKLEAQHAKLSKILERKGKGKKAPAPSPAARVGTKADESKTRPKSLEEDIAELKKEMGLK